MVYLCVACEDELEVRYKLDGSREAEVLRSRARSLANGQLHTVTVRRLTDAVSVQVTKHSTVIIIYTSLYVYNLYASQLKPSCRF